MLSVFTHFADWITFVVLGLDKSLPFAEAIHFFIEDTLKIFFLLIVLVYGVSWLRSWISPEKVRFWLEGKSRWVAYLLAAILGSITPFCSCSSVPLFIGFLSAGIPLGVAMAFLITSPMVNEIAVVLFGEALGWPFTIAYIAIGMLTGIIGGIAFDSFSKRDWVEDYVWDIHANNKVPVTHKLSLAEQNHYAMNEVKDIVGRVWKYILIGVALGAGLHGYVPKEWFIANAGATNPFAVPIATLIGIPLYSNVTGIVPIAEVLIQKGVPVGTTLAFIMSTVAISLPELFILRKVLKPKALVFFALFLLIAFNIVGYLFNWLFK